MIELHIERLVLDGALLEKRHGAQFQEALELELTRLLEINGLAEFVQEEVIIPKLQTSSFGCVSQGEPVGFGEQIAQAVYSEIGQGKEVKR